jgi:heptosyltransferase-1/heptosyltransferase-2
MSSLGDVLHTLPFAAALREVYPDARISWLVHPQFGDFIPCPGVIDEVIYFDRRALSSMGLGAKFRYLRTLRRELRARKFDLVIDMQGLFKSALMVWMSGCKNRIGYCEMREGSGLISRAIVGEHAQDHVIERYLDVARYLGWRGSSIDFPIADIAADEASARAKLLGAGVAGSYVVVAASARWQTKEWLPSHYIDLIRRIISDGCAVVLAGSAGDEARAQEIARDSGAVNLAGKTTLKELAALIKNCSLFISADTGPLHFAAAFKKPLIAMYGPTLAARTGPYGDPDAHVILSPAECRGCLRKKCSDWHCMSDITPDMVYQIFQKLAICKK